MEEKIKYEYTIVINMDEEEFEQGVVEFLNDGWELVGGPFVTVYGPNVYYNQALVRLPNVGI